MKNTKRRMELFFSYDRTGIQTHLQKMAAKGWMLEKMSNFSWHYRRIEPKALTFAVTYFPKASEFDPELTEGQRVYQDFTAHSGWQFVCRSAQMQVFCTEQENPVPIETDPMVEIEMIHGAAKKSHLLSHWLLLGVGLLNALLFLSRLLGDPIGVLASPANLFTGFAWSVMLLLCIVGLAGYYRWRRRALKAATHGEFTDTPNYAGFQKLMLCIVLVGFVWWILNLFAAGDRLLQTVALLMLLYMFGLFAIVNAVKQFLKKRKASRGTNLAITLTVDVVLAFGMMAAIVFGTLRAVQSGIFAPEAETYEHRGSTFVLYQDEIPLRVEDMLDVTYSGYICRKHSDESIFLGRYDMSQFPRFDDEAAHDVPGLDYTLTLVKAPFFYDLCRTRLIRERDETHDPDVPEGFKRVYLQEDPAPWGAEEAYRLAWQDTGPSNTYLLCYADRFVEISFDWEPTLEHMATVGEKLGGIA